MTSIIKIGNSTSPNPYDDLSKFIERIKPNIIRVPFKTKSPKGSLWKYLQDSIGSYDLFYEYRKKNIKSNWAIMTGRLLQGQFKGKYLVCVDLDNRKAIEIFLSFFPDIHSIEELSKLTIVVQHEDAKEEKAHVYFVTEKPITKISRKKEMEDKNEYLPVFEVKSDSSSLMISPSSVHLDGYPYKTMGTYEPMVLDANRSGWLENNLSEMLRLATNSDCGVQKDDKKFKIPDSLKRIAKNLKIDTKNDHSSIPVGTRNSTLFHFTLCMLGYHYKSKSENDLRSFLHQVNLQICIEPLPDSEVNSIFKSAYSYSLNKKESNNNINHINDHNTEELEDIIEHASKEISKKYHFITLKETKEIHYYRNGVYVTGGDIIIEEESEKLLGYQVKNKHITEIKGHIMRRTYHSRNEFDSNLNIINLRNGLYDIEKHNILPHDPEYLSINQKPIWYDPKAKPLLFGKFLKDILFDTDIRTIIEIMAYTFYRDCPFEHYFVFLGEGSNGKSVLTSLITALHGASNVSNASQSSLVYNRFALADLENKDVNIDNELSSNTNFDTAILKKLTGGRRQPTRIERKNQQPYDTYLYAKLFFNTNSKKEFSDNKTLADYRREVIIIFPNEFKDGKEDIDLPKKLTADNELSGIFNILMMSLRRILKNERIYLNEKTIEERRLKTVRVADPVGMFLEEAVEILEGEDNYNDPGFVTKDDLYIAYKKFCKKYKLPSKSKEIFCREVKKKKGFTESRKGDKKSNVRKYCWIGIKLRDEYTNAASTV